MAIDKNQTKELLNQIDALLQKEIAGGFKIPQALQSFVKEKILGEALAELRRLVEESRPPILYLIGRSGHGKSSLINALAGQDVAKVSPTPEPGQARAEKHSIQFPQRYAQWIVYDSRGIFESTPAKGADPKSAVEVARQEILEFKPDVVLHVAQISEAARAFGEDMKVMKQIQADVCLQRGSKVPIVMVLTHADTVGDVTEWPPEQHEEKRRQIEERVLAVGQREVKPDALKTIGSLSLYQGCVVDGDTHFLYVVPVNVPLKAKNRWNLQTLIDVLGGQLPYGARLQFFQALHRKEMLRQLAADLTQRFSAIAGGIGAMPIPIGDIFILTPLQIMLVAIIGGLSCREMSMKTVGEYSAGTGVVLATAIGFREAFRQALKFFGPVGDVVAGGMAAAATYGLGKSAEAYFFSGEVLAPASFAEQYKQERP